MAHQATTLLDQQTRHVFELVDAMDTKAMAAMLTDDAQGVDEISRGWMRGRAALEAYFGQLEQMVDDVHSEVSDIHVREHGDQGMVTCVVEQTYRMEGQEQHVTAPTSIHFERDGDDWKIAVFHSVPLPDQPAA
jgi:ketosteroid isomerase-like protein